MNEQTTDGLTELLEEFSARGDEARDEMFRRVYYEFRAHAEAHRAGEPLRAARLVEDVYEKLFRSADVHWRSRRQFFGVAASAMRSLLVDHARGRRRRLKE